MTILYSLGSDKNKKPSSKNIAKGNMSGTTSLSNNAIQNAAHLSRVNKHNLRKYENDTDAIQILYGSNNLYKDVQELYLQEFEFANSQIQAILNEQIKVTLNGQIKEFRDETTNELQYPITYQNRTYLPLRTIANLVGVDVDYDTITNTAKLITKKDEIDNNNQTDEKMEDKKALLYILETEIDFGCKVGVLFDDGIFYLLDIDNEEICHKYNNFKSINDFNDYILENGGYRNKESLEYEEYAKIVDKYDESLECQKVPLDEFEKVKNNIELLDNAVIDVKCSERNTVSVWKSDNKKIDLYVYEEMEGENKTEVTQEILDIIGFIK